MFCVVNIVNYILFILFLYRRYLRFMVFVYYFSLYCLINNFKFNDFSFYYSKYARSAGVMVDSKMAATINNKITIYKTLKDSVP